jgi:hypothetical protein
VVLTEVFLPSGEDQTLLSIELSNPFKSCSNNFSALKGFLRWGDAQADMIFFKKPATFFLTF